MKIIGITGGSGSGKTTLLRAVEKRGGLCIDCDALYHRLLQTDAGLLRALAERFPAAFLGGGLNCKALGELVFSDSVALQELNRITHQAVCREVERLLASSDAELAAIDAIALFESGLCSLCDLTVAVTAPEEVRIERLVGRDGISRN